MVGVHGELALSKDKLDKFDKSTNGLAKQNTVACDFDRDKKFLGANWRI